MVYTPQPTRPGGGCAATWPSNTLYYIHYFPTNCQNYNFVQLKTFSAHNRSENSHDVRGKRFSTHAETGCPRLFHVQNKPRRGWCLWRFASLIPSGCRLTPIHKVMGDHASRGSTSAGLFRRICFCYTHVIYSCL